MANSPNRANVRPKTEPVMEKVTCDNIDLVIFAELKNRKDR